MTREEALAIIHKEYLCVDRDCDIERSCGNCDLVMPSKWPILEAYKMAIKALEQEPCDDAISRQAVLDLIADYDLSMGQVVKGVHALPLVTPQLRIGHWIPRNAFLLQYKCSECEWESEKYNYCPHCGAKMQEVEE